MRRVVPLVLLAVLVVGACSDERAATRGTDAADVAPAEPGAATSTTGAPTTDATTDATIVESSDDPVVPDGFERIGATVTEPDGTVCELCLWLADTVERRRRGLMFVTDLGPADGMAFVYPGPHTGTFWMRNTLLPLSIAFFGPDGAYLDAFAMEPCTSEPCTQYPTPPDFLVAIETTQGDLPQLGIGPGSVLRLTDQPCEDVTAG